VLEDANSGRNWLSPTALTNPAGSWWFSDFELFMVGGGYAPTDRLSINATTLVPISSDQPFWGMLSIKYQLLRSGRLRLAGQFAGTLVADDEDGFTAGVLGGVATLCLDDHCRSHVSGYLGAGFADSDQSAVPFVVSGAAVFRVARRLKLLVEADSAFIAGDINETANGFLFWYGVRFTSSAIGVDVGFLRPIVPDEDWDDDVFPIGYPFVGLTYRGVPGD
jgi:hypothetical protein